MRCDSGHQLYQGCVPPAPVAAWELAARITGAANKRARPGILPGDRRFTLDSIPGSIQTAQRADSMMSSFPIDYFRPARLVLIITAANAYSWEMQASHPEPLGEAHYVDL